MGKLENYGVASASGKDDRIFNVFTKLQSLQGFDYQELVKSTGVEYKTLYNYLRDIFRANASDMRFVARYRVPFEETRFADMELLEKAVAEKEYPRWQEWVEEVQGLVTEKKYALSSYLFEETDKISREERYNRLETALLMTSKLKAFKA